MGARVLAHALPGGIYGLKHRCQCGKVFYDMGRAVATCPACSAEQPVQRTKVEVVAAPDGDESIRKARLVAGLDREEVRDTKRNDDTVGWAAHYDRYFDG